jgi:hypothetical protein
MSRAVSTGRLDPTLNRRMKLFFAVLGISLAGSLPPGVLNTGVVGLVAGAGPFAAAWFGLGAIVAEMGIVRVAHAGMGWLSRAPRVPRWARIGLSVLLVGVTLLLAAKGGGSTRYGQYPFLAGLVLGTLNPLHLPFWLGWTVVLRKKNILAGGRAEYDLFAVAIGAGTALAFLVYGTTGQLLLQWWQTGGSIK